MSLIAKLAARAAQGRPIHVGLIGAGKLGLELNAVCAAKQPEHRSNGAPMSQPERGGGPGWRGGYTVYGKLVPASRSLAKDLLPIGLAHNVKVRRSIPAGSFVKNGDVHLDETNLAVQTRREMERMSWHTGVKA